MNELENTTGYKLHLKTEAERKEALEIATRLGYKIPKGAGPKDYIEHPFLYLDADKKIRESMIFQCNPEYQYWRNELISLDIAIDRFNDWEKTREGFEYWSGKFEEYLNGTLETRLHPHEADVNEQPETEQPFVIDKIGEGHYQTRKGLPVRIYALDGQGEYPVHGAYFKDEEWNTDGWTENGSYYSNNDKSKTDLIPIDTSLIETPVPLNEEFLSNFPINLNDFYSYPKSDYSETIQENGTVVLNPTNTELDEARKWLQETDWHYNADKGQAIMGRNFVYDSVQEKDLLSLLVDFKNKS